MQIYRLSIAAALSTDSLFFAFCRFPTPGKNFSCVLNGVATLCAYMGQPDGKGPTGPGVSQVPAGYNPLINDPCKGNSVRDYTYFPQSWNNQTVATILPGYVNVFGNRMYDGKVRPPSPFAPIFRPEGSLRRFSPFWAS